jgi:hypothetical protein
LVRTAAERGNRGGEQSDGGGDMLGHERGVPPRRPQQTAGLRTIRRPRNSGRG